MPTPLRIAFRADASATLGAGHLTRCLALAVHLREHGAQCMFVCRQEDGSLHSLVASAGFALRLLPVSGEVAASRRAPPAPAHAPPAPAHAPPAPAHVPPAPAQACAFNWRADAEHTLACLGDTMPDWLIVDHYGIDAKWERLVRPACRWLMVIDDLANRGHGCDLLLDQNLDRSARDYHLLVPAQARVLAGAHYALLRPEFREWRAHSLGRRARFRLQHLLISLGGSDQVDATCSVLETLAQCTLHDGLRVAVVVGHGSARLDRVRAAALRLPWPTEVLVGVHNMAERMAGSDLAIGAAGGTAWERCALGLPSLVVVLAENQRGVAEALARHGAALVVSDPREIGCALRGLQDASGEERLQAMSGAASQLVDGAGAGRVCQELLAFHA